MSGAGELSVAAVTPDRWPDLETLFGPSGAYSGCWCTFLRQSSKDFERNCPNGGAANKTLLRDLVASGSRPGLLAYRGRRAIAWVAVALREEFPRVLRSPVHKPVDEVTGVWAITCFFIEKQERGGGVADFLLEAAIEHVRAEGGSIVEAYPLDTGGSRKPAADVWRGSLEQFERVGFRVVERRRPVRPIVRLML